MLKINIVALIFVSLTFSLWYTKTRSLRVEPLLKSDKLSSEQPLEEAGREDLLEDEVRRLKKTIRLQQKSLDRLNQDILLMDKKYRELWGLHEDHATEITAINFRLDRVDKNGKATLAEGEEKAPSSYSPYTMNKESDTNTSVNADGRPSASQDKTIPFHLILRVTSVTEPQKAKYRELILEHNQARTELIRNRGENAPREELQKQLEEHRKTYESKFMDILRSDQKAEFDNVLQEYYEQRDKNIKLQEERRQKMMQRMGNPSGEADKNAEAEKLRKQR